MVRYFFILTTLLLPIVLSGCVDGQITQTPQSTEVTLTPTPRETKAEQIIKLKQLITEVQISYFKKRFGEPEFLNYSQDRKQKEYIFIEENFSLQAITNPDDKVLAFTITTRSKDFNPVFTIGETKIVLGKTTFKKLNDTPEACYGFLGNTTRSFYVEQYYIPAGDYQTYIYGLNDAGYWNWHQVNISAFTKGRLIARDVLGETSTSHIPVDQYECETIPDKFRANTPINTRMVISAKLQVDELQFHFGVSRQEMRFIRSVIQDPDTE